MDWKHSHVPTMIEFPMGAAVLKRNLCKNRRVHALSVMKSLCDILHKKQGGTADNSVPGTVTVTETAI